MKIGKSRHTPKQKPKPAEVPGAPQRRQIGDPLPAGYVQGRPSAYQPGYCQALVDYFAGAEPWRIHFNNSGSAQVIPVDKTPSFKRFAVNIGVSTATLYKWAELNDDFKEAMEIARDAVYDFRSAQGSVGIGSAFNQFALRCEHGMVEPKQESTVEDGPIHKVVVEVVGANQHKGD